MSYEAPSVVGRVEDAIATTARCVVLPFKYMLTPSRALKQRRYVNLALRKYRNRITIDTDVQSPLLARIAEARDLIRELTLDMDWVSLAELLEEWDQDRASSPTQCRLVHLGLNEIWTTLTGEPRVASEACDFDAALSTLHKAALDHPDLYALKAISAHLQLDLCDQRDGASEMADALDNAGQTLSALDATTQNSPLVAFAKFRLALIDNASHSSVAQGYADWVMLDPYDQVAHSAFGLHQLHGESGSYETLETEARKAAATTCEQTGQAAYASMYLSALRADPKTLVHLDTELFGEGIKDLVKYCGNDPVFIAQMTQALQSLAQNLPRVGRKPELRAELQSKSKLLVRLTHRILRDNLSGIHAASWHGGMRGALEMISEACQRDLAKGAHLRLESSGLVAHHPMS